MTADIYFLTVPEVGRPGPKCGLAGLVSPKACLLELQVAAFLLIFTWSFPCYHLMPLVILPLPVKTLVRLD